MNESALYNRSGVAIPPEAEIEITGSCRSGDVLVIESFNGKKGVAVWRSLAELAASRAKQASPAATARPAWAPPLKPRAPYS